MKNRLKEYRNKARLTQMDVAELLSVSNATISRDEADFNFTVARLSEYARLYGCDPIELITDLPHLDWVSVQGAAEPGVLKNAERWPQTEWYQVAVPVPDEYKSAYHFGLEVRGESMNVAYPNGSVVICVPLSEVRRGLISGDHVVVCRSDAESGLLEVIVRELRYDQRGDAWLWPKSDSPEYQSPIRMTGRSDFEIRAVVIGSYTSRI